MASAASRATHRNPQGRTTTALWKRRAVIVLTTTIFAGTAFGLSSLLPISAATTTRFVLLDRGFAALTPVAGSVGEAVSAGGGALVAAFKASSDLLSGRAPDRSVAERIAEVLRSVPAGEASRRPELASQLLGAVGQTGAKAGDVASLGPSILADLTLPGEPAVLPALPIATLAGVAGLLLSSLGIVVADARMRRRRRPVRSRWDAMDDDEAHDQWRIDLPTIASPFIVDPSTDDEAKSPAEPLDLASDSHSAATEDESVASDAPSVSGEWAPSSIDGAADASPLLADMNAAADAQASGLELWAEFPEDEHLDSIDQAVMATILDFPFMSPAAEPVDAYDIAEAAMAVDVRVLLMVEASEGPRSCGSVDLVRTLAGLGVEAVLLDLGFDRVLADDLGIAEDACGLSDLLTGAAGISDIVHRDAASRADAIVWGRDGSADPIEGEALADLFASLREVYGCVVVAGGAMSLRSLAGLLGEDGAAVVSMRPGGIEAARERLAELAACGQPESLLMSVFPRNLRLMADMVDITGMAEAA